MSEEKFGMFTNAAGHTFNVQPICKKPKNSHVQTLQGKWLLCANPDHGKDAVWHRVEDWPKATPTDKMNRRILSPWWFLSVTTSLAAIGYFKGGELGAYKGAVFAMFLAHIALLEVLREREDEREDKL